MSTAAAADATLAERVQPLLDWVARQDQPVELELVCAEHPDPARGAKGRFVVVLPVCAASLPEHVLYEVLVLGAELVWVRTDGCAEVEATGARIAWMQSVLAAVGAGERLHAEAEPASQHRRRVLDATVMSVSRRRLLMLSECDAAPEEGASAHRRLVTTLRALAGAPSAAPGTPSELAGPGLALVSEGCTACGVCVRACPEDALALVDVEETGPDGAVITRTILRQYPAACGGAGACLQLCPEDALSAPEHWGLDALLEDDVVDLDEIAKAVCRRCGATFPDSGAELCELCSFRRANPFGGALPPAVAARFGPELARRFEGR